MKKILFLSSVFATLFFTNCSRIHYSEDQSILPNLAKSTIERHFKKGIHEVSSVRTMGFAQNYHVLLDDGTMIDFNRKGEWEGIDMPRGQNVPLGLVPKPIREKVATRYPGQKIENLDREEGEYELELSNGIDLVFDAKGNLIQGGK